jgi:4-hydroxyphenylpyruvate dioxygenase
MSTREPGLQNGRSKTLDSPISDHVRLHGDGVKDIAFRVDDASNAFEIALKRGALPVMEPTILENEHGRVTKSTILTFGGNIKALFEAVEREQAMRGNL